MIIHDVHKDLSDDPKPKVLAAHWGHKLTFQRLTQQICWHNMVEEQGNEVNRRKSL